MNKFITIPADILLDQKLCPNAKLIYGTISGLTNKFGFCFASNYRLSEIYKKSEKSISAWISSLEKEKHIIIAYNKRGFEVQKRYIFLSDHLLGYCQKKYKKIDEKNLKRAVISKLKASNKENFSEEEKFRRSEEEKFRRSEEEKFQYNNIVFNNIVLDIIINNIDDLESHVNLSEKEKESSNKTSNKTSNKKIESKWVDYWNEKGVVVHRVGSGVYNTAHKYCQALADGNFFRFVSIDYDWMEENNISKKLLKKKFTEKEIFNTIDLLAIACKEDPFYNEPKKGKKKPNITFANLLFSKVWDEKNKRYKPTGTSQFLFKKAHKEKLKIYYEKPRDQKMFQLYYDFYEDNELFETEGQKRMLVKNFNRLYKEFEYIQNELGPKYEKIRGDWFTHLGSLKEPKRFVDTHLEFLSSWRGKKIHPNALNPGSGLYKYFVNYVKDHYDFYIQPTEEEEESLNKRAKGRVYIKKTKKEKMKEWEEEKRRVKEKCFASGKCNEDVNDMNIVLELLEEDPEFRARFSQ